MGDKRGVWGGGAWTTGRQDQWSLGRNRRAPPPATRDRAWERRRGPRGPGLVPSDGGARKAGQRPLGQGIRR